MARRPSICRLTGRAPIAQPPGKRDIGVPVARHQRPQHQDRGAHGLHQLIGRDETGQRAGLDQDCGRPGAASDARPCAPGASRSWSISRSRGTLVERHRRIGQEGGGQDRQGGVLGAGSPHLAVQRVPACDEEFIHEDVRAVLEELGGRSRGINRRLASGGADSRRPRSAQATREDGDRSGICPAAWASSIHSSKSARPALLAVPTPERSISRDPAPPAAASRSKAPPSAASRETVVKSSVPDNIQRPGDACNSLVSVTPDPCDSCPPVCRSDRRPHSGGSRWRSCCDNSRPGWRC